MKKYQWKTQTWILERQPGILYLIYYHKICLEGSRDEVQDVQLESCSTADDLNQLLRDDSLSGTVVGQGQLVNHLTWEGKYDGPNKSSLKTSMWHQVHKIQLAESKKFKLQNQYTEYFLLDHWQRIGSDFLISFRNDSWYFPWRNQQQIWIDIIWMNKDWFHSESQLIMAQSHGLNAKQSEISWSCLMGCSLCMQLPIRFCRHSGIPLSCGQQGPRWLTTAQMIIG